VPDVNLRDLNAESEDVEVCTDVAIIGSGPVGLTLAVGLAERGLKVLIIEKGGVRPRRVEEAQVSFERHEYAGAIRGRTEGLGGTSSLWGGQLLPIKDEELSAWPLPPSDLWPYFEELQTWLRVGSSPFEFDPKHCPAALASLDFTDWRPRMSKWLTFGQRNLASFWRARLARGHVELWLNAAAKDWETSPGSASVQAIEARSPSGRRLRVAADHFVIAAGALESARAVQSLSERMDLSTGVNSHAGRFLHDHLSLRIARLNIRDRRAIDARFAPFFRGATMRSLRMELDPEVSRSARLPPLYLHFVAHAGEDSGFAVLRDLLRAAQRRDRAALIERLKALPRSTPDIVRLLYARFIDRRLAFPADSSVCVHIDIQQTPRARNRVRGHATGSLSVDWEIGDELRPIARSVASHLARFWRRNGLEQFALLDFNDIEHENAFGISNLYDIYHPAGTTRMSLDPAAGVVDAHLKVHGSGNVFVAGSSVFPAMGAANPTFTAMALALRLRDFILTERHA
jgi:choline dehydrogenase-like flavoprotein